LIIQTPLLCVYTNNSIDEMLQTWLLVLVIASLGSLNAHTNNGAEYL